MGEDSDRREALDEIEIRIWEPSPVYSRERSDDTFVLKRSQRDEGAPQAFSM